MPYLTMIYVISALVMQNQQLIGNDREGAFLCFFSIELPLLSSFSGP